MSAEKLVESAEAGVERPAGADHNSSSHHGSHTRTDTISDKSVDETHFVFRIITTMRAKNSSSLPRYSSGRFQTLRESTLHLGRRRVGSTGVSYYRILGVSPEVSSAVCNDIAESLLEGPNTGHLL